MADLACDCCGQPRPIAARIVRRQVRRNGENLDSREAPARAHPLCPACASWLTTVILQACYPEADSRVEHLLGSPGANGRSLLFDDQCQVCRELLGPTASLIEWRPRTSPHSPWIALLVCPSCEGWIASLADDGRSARGAVARELDGAYGDWLHPNLRRLAVQLEVSDEGARETIFESCAEMEVRVLERGQPGADVLFIEAGHAGFAGARSLRPVSPAARIVLASLSARDDLAAALADGAIDWLTVPLTPQQVTSALTKVLRQWVRRLPWDTETCLPIAVLDGERRPALRVEPAPGVDRFELGWLLKRFSRGYDDVVVVGGDIIVLPRVAPRHIEEVARRLERVLNQRCTLTEFAPPAFHRGFEAAG